MHDARRLWLAGAAAVAAAIVAEAQPRFDQEARARLEQATLGGHALIYATELTQTIGARVAGSPAYLRAAQWAVEQFKAAGVSRVALEPFTIPRGWQREQRGRARVIAPVERPLAVESFGWAPSLPDRGIEADVIAGDEALASHPERARNRIVLAAGDISRDFERRLVKAGALALLFTDSGDDDEVAVRVRAFTGDIAALPIASIGADSGELLRDLMRKGPVRISVEYHNRISDGPVTMPNVIAEIAGRDHPDEFIVVGAHLDSWDFATGAQDNATGVAMVLEAARAIAALGRPPGRTIRFALWGAEEQGLLGSAAYVRAHAHELDHCVAVLNADGGTGRIIGWTTPGREDAMRAVNDLSRALLKGLHADAVDKSMQYAFDSDGAPFIRQGIPTLDMNTDDEPYERIHHKQTDTLERIDNQNLAIGAAMVAITAWAIADAPQRIAPRGPRLKE